MRQPLQKTTTARWASGFTGGAHAVRAEGRICRCLANHAAFHVEAGKVATIINAKKKDEAEKMLASSSAFAEASKKVGISIIELKNEIGG